MHNQELQPKLWDDGDVNAVWIAEKKTKKTALLCSNFLNWTGMFFGDGFNPEKAQ